MPPSAVQTGPSQSFVFVLQPDHTVKQTNVTVGQQNDKLAVIQSGLAAGDQVVLQGASRLSDGSKVRVVNPPSGQQQPSGHQQSAAQQQTSDQQQLSDQQPFDQQHKHRHGHWHHEGDNGTAQHS